MRSILPTILLCALGSAHATLAPVNPNATPEAKKLYTYLQNLSGQGILSGQLSMLNDSILYTDTQVTSSRDRYVMKHDGGKLPAIYASNLGDWPMNYQFEIVKTIEGRWKTTGGKAIAMLCWHAVQPDGYEDSGYAVMSKFSSSNPYPSWKIDSILKPGTALNVEWMRRMKVAGSYLQSLDSAGIPVLWRPFHENNGAFFWWGQQPRFKELWRQMYDYYTDSLHLNNLLWVYSTCGFGQGDHWIDSLYPGEKYVDVLGADIYGGSYDPWIYGTLLSKANGKPIGITENGSMPNVPKLKYTQPKWAFFCTWWGYEVDTMWANAYYHPAGYSIQNTQSLYDAVYSDPYTITQDEIDFGIAPDTHVFLSTGVFPTGSGSMLATPDSNGRYQAGQAITLTAKPTAGWDFVGWSGDASGSANPLAVTLSKDRSYTAVFAARKGTNLLLNGNFSDSMNGWSYSPWETGTAAAATIEGTDSVFHAVVTAKSSHDYGIQLTQGLVLDSGTTYSFSFDVHGAAGVSIGYAVGESAGKYRKLLSGGDTLSSTSVATVTGSFTDTLPSATALRVEFEMGAQLGDLWLDNIKIARTSGSDIPASISHSTASAIAQIALHRTAAGLAWNRSGDLSSAATLRLLRPDGRLVAQLSLPAGLATGIVPGELPHGTLIARLRTAASSQVQTIALP